MMANYQESIAAAMAQKQLKQAARGLAKPITGRKSVADLGGCNHFKVVYTSGPHSRSGNRVPHFKASLMPESHEAGCSHPATLGGAGGTSVPRFGIGRAPRRTGQSAFQTYRREVDPNKQVRCEAIIRAHKVIESQCSRKSLPNAKLCRQHGGTPGAPKARNGVLVELKLEEVPVLLCDR
jgi:hypothetical protein